MLIYKPFCIFIWFVTDIKIGCVFMCLALFCYSKNGPKNLALGEFTLSNFYKWYKFITEGREDINNVDPKKSENDTRNDPDLLKSHNRWRTWTYDVKSSQVGAARRAKTNKSSQSSIMCENFLRLRWRGPSWFFGHTQHRNHISIPVFTKVDPLRLFPLPKKT